MVLLNKTDFHSNLKLKKKSIKNLLSVILHQTDSYAGNNEPREISVTGGKHV